VSTVDDSLQSKNRKQVRQQSKECLIRLLHSGNLSVVGQNFSSRGYVKKLKMKRQKPKPVWDDSVNDLTVHKPTSQELKRNHELHQPKKDHERLLQKIESAKSSLNDGYSSSFYSHDGESPFVTKQAFAKHVSYNQERELNDLLSETDKTISEFDDMFGNNIYKYKSIPVVTKAPKFNKDVVVNDISVLNPGDQAYYGKLSESIARDGNNTHNSSDVDSSIDSSAEEDDVVNTRTMGEGNVKKHTFQGKVNIDHYQNLLSQGSTELYQNSNKISVPDIKSLTEEFSESIMENDAKSSASINDGKCKDVKTSASALQTFGDMKHMLDSLEGEIEEYEKETGKVNITKKVEVPSFVSGYTANLLSIIIRLTHHLKESEVQLKAEMAMRKEIVDMYDDQRGIVDVLTTNVLELQESNNALKKELLSQATACQTHHTNLKKEFDDLEARFNVAFFNPGSDQKLHSLTRKPFSDITNNSMVIPVWEEAS